MENAFVAVHHDRIIDLGTHDYHTWVDKDTRLIDAANEIVVPAFIDPHVRFSFNQKNGDNLRINRETMELFYKNGITTMAAEELPDIASTPFFELIRFKPKKKMALVDYHYLSNRILPKHFLLSTSFSYDSDPFYDLMPLASLLCMEQAVTEEEVLASMTLYPARKLHLQRQKEGMFVERRVFICFFKGEVACQCVGNLIRKIEDGLVSAFPGHHKAVCSKIDILVVQADKLADTDPCAQKESQNSHVTDFCILVIAFLVLAHTFSVFCAI